MNADLCRVEPVIINGQWCEPGRCSFLLRKHHATLEMGWELVSEILGIFPLLLTTLKIKIPRVNSLDATNSQTSGSHCVYPLEREELNTE